MDAAYLQSTLGDLLAEGLAATLLRNPADKVEFLAQWLRKSVEEKSGAEARNKEVEQLKRRDVEIAAGEQADEQKAAAAEASKLSTGSEREKQFQHLLDTATSEDALLPAFLQFLRDLTGATSAYVGRVEQPDKESDAGPSLKYVAATPDNEWLLEKRLSQKKGKVTFELFGEEEPEEEPEEEEDENGNPIVKPKKEKDPRSVFVPNVLMGPKSANLHFWKLPQLGSYIAVKLKFQQCVSDEALDEAAEREAEILALKREQDEAKAQAAKEAAEEAAREAGLDVDEEDEERESGDEDEEEEEEDDARKRRSAAKKKKGGAQDEKDDDDDDEEEKEETEEEREAREQAEDKQRLEEEEEFLLTQLQSRTPAEYALCLDTLGQNRRFSSDQIATIVRYAKALQTKLVALDRAQFTVERRRRMAMLEFQREVAEMNEGAGGGGQGGIKTEEEKAEELERLSDELEASGKPMTDEDVMYKWRTELLLSPQVKAQLAEFAEYAVFPRGNLAVLQAMLFLLGYEKKRVVDAEDRPEWKRMRLAAGVGSEEFFARLRDFDPRASSHESVPADQRYTQAVVVSKIIEACPSVEELRERQYVLSEILAWVKDCLAVKRRARVERQKAARDEARKRAAEEAAAREEAERKAAEEEEAARIAAGGEPAERDEDEEEEEEEEED